MGDAYDTKKHEDMFDLQRQKSNRRDVNVLWSGVALKKKTTGRTASALLSRNVRLARGPDSFNLMIDKKIFP